MEHVRSINDDPCRIYPIITPVLLAAILHRIRNGLQKSSNNLYTLSTILPIQSATCC